MRFVRNAGTLKVSVSKVEHILHKTGCGVLPYKPQMVASKITYHPCSAPLQGINETGGPKSAGLLESNSVHVTRTVCAYFLVADPTSTQCCHWGGSFN